MRGMIIADAEMVGFKDRLEEKTRGSFTCRSRDQNRKEFFLRMTCGLEQMFHPFEIKKGIRWKSA